MSAGASFEETLDAMASAEGPDALRALLLDLRDAHELANVVYHAIDVPGCARENPILMLSYDPAWVDRYVSENYFAIDPVVEAGGRAFLPLDWAEVDRSTSAARHLFGEAESHGVGRQGVTIPIRGPSGERAVFSMTANLSDDVWAARRTDLLRDWHATAHFFHDRAVHLSGLRKSRPPELSRRERQCLALLAQGRKPKVIADQLEISESAVRLYSKSARHKMRCKTVMQAVAKAITLEMIAA